MFKGSMSDRSEEGRQTVFTSLSYASKEMWMEGKSLSAATFILGSAI
jgi:hypothetical protein